MAHFTLFGWMTAFLYAILITDRLIKKLCENCFSKWESDWIEVFPSTLLRFKTVNCGHFCGGKFSRFLPSLGLCVGFQLTVGVLSIFHFLCQFLFPSYLNSQSVVFKKNSKNKTVVKNTKFTEQNNSTVSETLNKDLTFEYGIWV